MNELDGEIELRRHRTPVAVASDFPGPLAQQRALAIRAELVAHDPSNVVWSGASRRAISGSVISMQSAAT